MSFDSVMASSPTVRRLLFSSIFPKSFAPLLSSSARSISTTRSAATKYVISTAPSDYGDDGEGDFYSEEVEKAYYIRLNMPEVEKKDVNVEVNRKENTVTVTGRAGLGRYRHYYDLPELCETDYTKAEMNDGVLKVVVPKVVVPKVLDEKGDNNSEIFSVNIE